MAITLDAVDRRILSLLQRDARVSMRALGKAVGLSGPAAAERVRKLEDRGIVRGYHAEVEPEAIGLAISAFLTVSVGGETRHSSRLERLAHAMPEVAECYRVTGDDAYVLRVSVADIAALQDTIDRVREWGHVRSAIVLSRIKRRGELMPPAARAVEPIVHQGAD